MDKQFYKKEVNLSKDRSIPRIIISIILFDSVEQLVQLAHLKWSPQSMENEEINIHNFFSNFNHIMLNKEPWKILLNVIIRIVSIFVNFIFLNKEER